MNATFAGCALLLIPLLALVLSVLGIIVVATSQGARRGLGYGIGGVLLSLPLVFGFPLLFVAGLRGMAMARSERERVLHEETVRREVGTRIHTVRNVPLDAVWPASSDLPEGWSFDGPVTRTETEEEIRTILRETEFDDESRAPEYRRIWVGRLDGGRVTQVGVEMRPERDPAMAFPQFIAGAQTLMGYPSGNCGPRTRLVLYGDRSARPGALEALTEAFNRRWFRKGPATGR